MEAGNRCYDLNVPEEVNRRIIDHSSDILLPYTERSCENLIYEGIPRRRIYITGNPIFEVINKNKNKINSSKILEKLKIKKKKYFLLTMHREENVDKSSKLSEFVDALIHINKVYSLPVIWPIHPRSIKVLTSLQKKNLQKHNIIFIKPLGFFDFVYIEKNAFCVLTDSGTVQEECSIFKVPNITLRDTTERPETIESGSNLITSSDIDIIINAIKFSVENVNCIKAPTEYLFDDVSSIVCKILLSNNIRTYA